MSFIHTITNALLLEKSPQKASYVTTALGANVKHYTPHTLKNHPFLMDETYDKMQILSRGWHLYKIYRGETFLYKFLAMDEYCGARKSMGWFTGRMSAELREIYSHEVTNEGESKYDTYLVQDLLRFLRNVYEHYMDNGMNIATIYIEIEQLWPFFIDKVYGRIITICR